MRVACPSCEAPLHLPEDEVPADGAGSVCSGCATPVAFVHVPAGPGEEVFGPAAEREAASPFFDHFPAKSYTLRTLPFKLFGGGIELYDPSGALCGYVHQKAFKLKEDIVLFADEERTRELLRIEARTMQDISGVYEVVDPSSDREVGGLRRSGAKSLLRDSWSILDAGGEEVGTISEDSAAMATARRLLPLGALIPQGFEGEIRDRPVFRFEQKFNPFVLYLDLDFHRDVEGRLDRRLGIAAGILLSLIEGRQSS